MANSGTELLVRGAVVWTPMAKYEVGFDGRWQETFDDRELAFSGREKSRRQGEL
jgi:hypothetical protein